MSAIIESAIKTEDWSRARRLIKAALRKDPRSHWLLTRLGLTYYEQYRYREALQVERRALRLAPSCPLVLWDYAGSLQMLGRHKRAVDVYQSLTVRRLHDVAFGPCGEGLARARGLIADCYYRLSTSYSALGLRRQALHAMRFHLKRRGPGCHSIYSKREAVAVLALLKGGAA